MIFVGVFPTVTSLVVAIYIMNIVASHRRQLMEGKYLIFFNLLIYKLCLLLKRKYMTSI